MKLRDLKILDVFKFPDDDHQYMMNDITGRDYQYVTYCLLRKDGNMGCSYYTSDDCDVTKIGNARDIHPIKYKDWYNWRK